MNLGILVDGEFVKFYDILEVRRVLLTGWVFKPETVPWRCARCD